MKLARAAIVVVLLAILGGTFWLSLPEVNQPVRAGEAAVDFQLPDLQGKMHSLPKGDVVILNFWATWCPPCREEIPSMAKLHERFAAKGLRVVAVSVDQNDEDLAGFVREHQLPFEVLHDPEARVSRRYGVFKYPESFLIDRNGVVRHHLVGAVDWTSEPVVEAVEALLSGGIGEQPDD
ncbi:MAG: TlpA family protein disulfide reductase [Zetaproteobacteria bacterium]|nr:MAG: TlpA family protein disulfide reductase [Zetaproteobacteria bacterium]